MANTSMYNTSGGLESGLRTGLVIGQGLRQMQSRNALQDAAALIQQGQDPNAVIQQLMSMDPAAAQQLLNMQTQQQQQAIQKQEMDMLQQKYGKERLQMAGLPLFGAIMQDDPKVQDKLIDEASAVFKGQSDGVYDALQSIKQLPLDGRVNALGGIVKSLRQAGVFPDDPSQMMQGQSADIAKFEYWKQLNPNATPEQAQQMYNKIIDPYSRAFATGVGSGQARLMTEQGLTPELANRERQLTVERGRGEQQVTSEVNAKKNSNAYQTYKTAIGQLEQSASQTTTNPVVGLLPAVTANAQIMEGAVSMMAPVLKEMFRQAGEGTFTDKDQELLLKMVPTRNEHPEAIKAKLGMIDNLVRAKLQQGAPQDGLGQSVQPRNFEQQYMGRN